MNTILVAILAAFSLTAQAETINLGDSPCTATALCIEVPNDAGLDINLSAYPPYRSVMLQINGVTYSASNVPVTEAGFDSVTVYSQTGYAVVSAQFRYWLTRQCSGRGGCRNTPHFELLGGTVTRP